MQKPVNRREMMRWLLGLSAGAVAGLCGIGGFAGFLALRRFANDPLSAATSTPLPTPTMTPPPIVPRAAWNARPVNHEAENEHGFASAANPEGWHYYETDLGKILKTVAIHHSYPVTGAGNMRMLQDIHMDIRKWADIAYHFGVGRDGTIYEGRSIQARGTNVAGYNTGTVGVVLIGSFDTESPSNQQLDATLRLAIWLTRSFNMTHLAAHRDFNPTTECPGQNMLPYLDILATNAGLKRGTGGYVPPTPMKTMHLRGDENHTILTACC